MCERDRPATEDKIEVTEEMIQAGVRELSTYSPSFEMIEDAVARVYAAMERAR